MESKTKKKLGAAGASAAAVGAAIALTAGTFSYFSDATHADGSVHYGTVKLGNHFSGADLNLNNMYPGKTVTRTWNLANNGSIDGKLRIGFGSQSASKTKDLKVTVKRGSHTGTFSQSGNSNAFINAGNLREGKTTKVTIKVHMKDDGNQNELQGKRATAKLKADLVQGKAPSFPAHDRS
jgi:predicted ribosomally synthesized peptide with SipW-like signal peptide